jgi:hypothetical protein
MLYILNPTENKKMSTNGYADFQTNVGFSETQAVWQIIDTKLNHVEPKVAILIARFSDNRGISSVPQAVIVARIISDATRSGLPTYCLADDEVAAILEGDDFDNIDQIILDIQFLANHTFCFVGPGVSTAYAAAPQDGMTTDELYMRVQERLVKAA